MPPDRALDDGVIELWLFDLDQPQHELKSLQGLLCEEERTRAAGFVFEADRDRYIAGRGRLRTIIADYIGVAPQHIRFDYNDYGKPALHREHETDLHFNLSHSAGSAILAVSGRYQIGVDIEEVAPLKEDVANYFFSPAERRDLAALPVAEYLNGFFRCWTRKEAFVKAHGAGLSLPLQSFDVSITDEEAPALYRLESEPSGPNDWKLFNLALDGNLAGAVAALTYGRSPALLWRSLEELYPVSRASRI